MENQLTIPINYILVQTKQQFEEVLNKCLSVELYANDIETTGVNRYADKIVGIALSWNAGESAYIPIGHSDGNVSFDVWSHPKLKELLETKPCVCHNAKFEYGMFKAIGIDLSYKHDTLIQCFLSGKFELQGDRVRNGLKDAVELFFRHKMVHIEDLFNNSKKKVKKDSIHMDRLSAEEVYLYACADADWTLRLHTALFSSIKGSSREFLYNVEMGVIKVVYKMECAGLRLDTDYFTNKTKELNDFANRLQKYIFEQVSLIAGHEVIFNMNKAADVGQVLYDILKLPILERTERTNAPSTSEETLEKLAKQAPIAKNILTWRQVTKQVSTFYGKLPICAEDYPDKMLHTDLLQAHAASGRFASKNPNCQNIPK